MENEKQIVEIDKQLRKGDKVIIAKMTELNPYSVRYMFSGVRPMNPLVLEAAQKLIKMRQAKVTEAIDKLKANTER